MPLKTEKYRAVDGRWQVVTQNIFFLCFEISYLPAGGRVGWLLFLSYYFVRVGEACKRVTFPVVRNISVVLPSGAPYRVHNCRRC